MTGLTCVSQRNVNVICSPAVPPHLNADGFGIGWYIDEQNTDGDAVEGGEGASEAEVPAMPCHRESSQTQVKRGGARLVFIPALPQRGTTQTLQI